MTSDEIERLQLPDSSGPIDREEARYLMLREIAYQLARFNELFRAALSVQFPSDFH